MRGHGEGGDGAARPDQVEEDCGGGAAAAAEAAEPDARTQEEPGGHRARGEEIERAGLSQNAPKISKCQKGAREPTKCRKS